MARGHAGRAIALLALCLLAGAGLAAGGPAVADAGGSAIADADGPAVADAPVHESTYTSAAAADAETFGESGAASEHGNRFQTATSRSATRQSEGDIELAQSLQLTPDRPGSYDAVNRYEIPASVTDLSIEVQDRDAVVAAEGFQQAGPTTWGWDGSTYTPSLTLRVAANQTIDGRGPIGTEGDYRFVDVGEWALVVQPQTRHQWTSRGADFEKAATVDGEGTMGEAIAFLGPHEVDSRSAHGQTIDLVVPESATIEANRDALFASLFSASDSLRVGDRDEAVFVVAAPTEQIEWGVRGVQTADADVWVRDEEPLADADNVWLHEYVHTRQGFETTDETRWLTEAGATYYAARLAHEQGLVTFDQFQRTLARGTNDRFQGVVLADPSTWVADPQYAVGGLVTGDLDRRTRLATGSSASFDRVFARLNAHEGAIDGSAFYGHLAAVAGGDVAAAGRHSATTTDRPRVWNATQHGAAFGVTPARFAVTFDGAEAFDVSGAYRNRSLGTERPLVVVEGERVNASVGVANTGDVAGEYDVGLAVDGLTVATTGGQLGAGEATTHVLGHRFEEVGSHTLAVADDRVDVEVREPAAPTVTGFDADRTTIEPGESVTLTVAVENRADRPAGGAIPVTRNGTRIAERSVRLDVDEETTRTVETTLEASGEYTFGLGDASDRTVTVVVTEPFPVGVVLVGGGVVLAVLVIGAGLLLWRRRQRGPGTSDDDTVDR